MRTGLRWSNVRRGRQSYDATRSGRVGFERYARPRAAQPQDNLSNSRFIGKRNCRVAGCGTREAGCGNREAGDGRRESVSSLALGMTAFVASRQSLRTQCLRGMHAGSAAGRQPARHDHRDHQHDDDRNERRGVRRRDAIEQRSQHPGRRQRTHET